MKLPYFFIYAKDKKKEQVNLKNKSTMNRIAEKIPDSKIIFSESINKFEWINNPWPWENTGGTKYV